MSPPPGPAGGGADRRLRQRVATATKILVRERLIGPFGHPSARVPAGPPGEGPETGHSRRPGREHGDRVAILGHTRDHVSNLAATSASDVVLIDLDGAIADQRLKQGHSAPGERFIHTEIYRARPDVGAVVHAHPMNCVAFSIAGRPILPIWHLCTHFADGIGAYESSVQIETPELGRDLAGALGARRAVLLKGHGVVVVGATIEEATVSAVNLERSARLQLAVEGIGEPRTIPRHELNDDLLSIGLTMREYVHAQWDYWAAEVG